MDRLRQEFSTVYVAAHADRELHAGRYDVSQVEGSTSARSKSSSKSQVPCGMPPR
jgi:hypothetical protein